MSKPVYFKSLSVSVVSLALSACATTYSSFNDAPLDLKNRITELTLSATDAWSPESGVFDIADVEQFYMQNENLLAYDQTSPSTTVIRGYDKWKAVWTPFMAGFTDWSFRPASEIEVRAGSDVSVATFLVNVQGTTIADGSLFEAQGHVTWVWQNTDAGWVIGHEHISFPAKP